LVQSLPVEAVVDIGVLKQPQVSVVVERVEVGVVETKGRSQPLAEQLID
jgi:hypothetical protein